MLWKRPDYRLEFQAKYDNSNQCITFFYFFFSLLVIIILHFIRKSPLPEDGCDSTSNPCDPGERPNGRETIVRLE